MLETACFHFNHANNLGKWDFDLWEEDLEHPVYYNWLWRFILQEMCSCVPECILYSLSREREGVGCHSTVSHEDIKYFEK